MHPFLLDELAAARVDELRREASRERLALSVPHRPTHLAQATRRWLRAAGFLLVGAGLRLVVAGERRDQARRSVA